MALMNERGGKHNTSLSTEYASLASSSLLPVVRGECILPAQASPSFTKQDSEPLSESYKCGTRGERETKTQTETQTHRRRHREPTIISIFLLKQERRGSEMVPWVRALGPSLVT